MYNKHTQHTGKKGTSRFQSRGNHRPFTPRGQGSAHTKRFSGSYIDPAKFVNRAVITEEMEHFVPEHRFEDFAVDSRLKQMIVAKGYMTPTPIQDRSIVHMLSGADLVGIANTGTGKTAAFLIPLINHVLHNAKSQKLIVVPTRELALQIEQELKEFTAGLRVFSVTCVGGAPIGPQLRALSHHNHFIIGTPGRLKDLIQRGKIHLKNFDAIVLDEADR